MTNLYLVIYQHVVLKIPRGYKAEIQTYTKWEDADARAKQCAKDRRVSAWVYEIPAPPVLEEIPKDNKGPLIKGMGCPKCGYRHPPDGMCV